MPSQADIDHQQQLLALNRKNLKLLSTQKTAYGDLAVPLHILNQISSTEDEIGRIKGILRDWKQPFENLPGEPHVEPQAAAPVQATPVQVAVSGLRRLSFSERTALVDALLACPAVSNRGSRDAVLEQLPQIKASVPYHPNDRQHVLAIVTASENYTGALRELIEVVRFFEQNSLPMQEVDRVAQRLALP